MGQPVNPKKRYKPDSLTAEVKSEVTSKSQAEAEFERQSKAEDERYKRRKDFISFIVKDIIVFSVAIAFILSVGAYSLFILFKNSSSIDEKQFAKTVIALIVTGLISFVTGRATALPK
jgi:hypothetical protein